MRAPFIERRRFLRSILCGVSAALLLATSIPRLSAAVKPPPPAAFVEGSWTLVLLPDTQFYSAKYPGLFDAQTSWIARNKEKRDIRYVLHLGDVTDNGKEDQWRHARNAMSLLDGKVPYAIAAGNHDYVSPSTGQTKTRKSLLGEFFPPAEFKKWPTFGGLMNEGELENSYHLFSAGGREWIVLCLEWAPRDETIAWANEALNKYPKRKAILVTHAYLFDDGTRLDYAAKGKKQHDNPHAYSTPGTMNDGEELWNKLVKKHDFAFVVCGHIAAKNTPCLDGKNEKGTTTHQILSDFQDRKLGGEAYLTLLEFLPDGNSVQVKNYSPLYDSYLTGPKQQYTLKLE